MTLLLVAAAGAAEIQIGLAFGWSSREARHPWGHFHVALDGSLGALYVPEASPGHFPQVGALCELRVSLEGQSDIALGGFAGVRKVRSGFARSGLQAEVSFARTGDSTGFRLGATDYAWGHQVRGSVTLGRGVVYSVAGGHRVEPSAFLRHEYTDATTKTH
ncbi:MAG: hypothetical protein H6737_32045 [Alphaproteobacteria bacterium]|nr:hypothetical protein [Alphaproteobacteria bacterium]